MSHLKMFADLARPKLPFATAYEAGYNCGVRGPNTDNCHFGFFGSPASTKEWERGKAAGDRDRENGTTGKR